MQLKIVESQYFLTSVELEELQNKDLDLAEYTVKKAELQKQHDDELNQVDIKIITQLDQKVNDEYLFLY